MLRTLIAPAALAVGILTHGGLEPATVEAKTHVNDETELAKQMLVIQDGLRALRRSTRDVATYPDALATVVECQQATLASKTEAPVKAAKVPEAERAAFVNAYRVDMIEMMEHFLKLERALLEGADPAAVKEISSAIKGLEDPAHEQYTEDG